MDFASTFFLSLLAMMLTFSAIIVVHSNPLVPAILIFGDSSVDVGNNNNLHTIIKANTLPYGRDFVTHKPTGRFSNGKLVVDFIAEYLGFTSYPRPYLSQESHGENFLIGCNFASAGSGYSSLQSRTTGTIPLDQQLQYYKEYQTRVVNLVGEAKANEILSDAIFFLATGSTDFITYFLVPHLDKAIPLDQFINILLKSYTDFIENLYAMGARKIAVASLTAIGCFPTLVTMLGEKNQCVGFVNQAAIAFNIELNKTSESLKSKFPDLRLLPFDLYNPLLDIVERPSFYGLSETRRGCCGLGVLAFTSLLCNPLSVGTCSNASHYVFWDGIHPTQATYKVLASSLIKVGAPLIPSIHN